MQKVIITGVNGFVGHHLSKEMAENGFTVIGVGGPSGRDDDPYLSKKLSLDLTDRKETEKIDFSDVYGVVHLAGLAAVGPSFEEPMKYIDTNIGIESNLFEAALAQGASPRFLIISTGALYDPSAKLPLTELSTVSPSSPYAVSKIGQEEMAKYYAKRGFEIIVARPFNHIGPGQGTGFIVPDLTQQVVAVAKGESSELLVGNLEAKRDYTDVRDIARAYRLLLERGRPHETYNVCSGVAYSGEELLEAILKVAACKPEIKQDPAKMRPSDTPELYGSHGKLSKDTGWQPQISLEETLKDVVADWQSRS
jgi:GDP-4-dehydro-6-deoxy-D-mannose reductase